TLPVSVSVAVKMLERINPRVLYSSTPDTQRVQDERNVPHFVIFFIMFTYTRHLYRHGFPYHTPIPPLHYLIRVWQMPVLSSLPPMAVIGELINFLEDWAAATDITYTFLAAEIPDFEYQNIHAWFFRGSLEIVKFICITPLLLCIFVEFLVKCVWSFVVGFVFWILGVEFGKNKVDRRVKLTKVVEFGPENLDRAFMVEHRIIDTEEEDILDYTLKLMQDMELEAEQLAQI